jgi:hypothetical protein
MRWDERGAPTPVADIEAVRAKAPRFAVQSIAAPPIPMPTIGQLIYRQTATVDQMMRARLFSRFVPAARKRTVKE